MFRVKVFHIALGSHAYTRQSKNISLVNEWVENIRKNYINNIITIQIKEKGIWQDWCLV